MHVVLYHPLVPYFPYNPPCIAKEDKMRTSELMIPHENGIHVDMRK